RDRNVTGVQTCALPIYQGTVFSYGTVEETFSRAEEIEKIGLSVPQVTKLFDMLSKSGYEINEHVYDLDRAEKLLMQLISQKGGKIGRASCRERVEGREG